MNAEKNEVTLRKTRKDRQARAHRLIYGQMSKQEQDAAYEERVMRGTEIRRMSAGSGEHVSRTEANTGQRK